MTNMDSCSLQPLSSLCRRLRQRYLCPSMWRLCNSSSGQAACRHKGLTAPCALVLGRFKDVPGRATAAVALSSMSKSATPCRMRGDLSDFASRLHAKSSVQAFRSSALKP